MATSLRCVAVVVNSSWRNSLWQELEGRQETVFSFISSSSQFRGRFFCCVLFCMGSWKTLHRGEPFVQQLVTTLPRFHRFLWSPGRCVCYSPFSISVSVFHTLSGLQILHPRNHLHLSLALLLSSRKLDLRHKGKVAVFSHPRQSFHAVVLCTMYT